MNVITPMHYIVLSALIFGIGVAGVLSRKNVFTVLMSVELMLNAANLTFITFARSLADPAGQMIVLFVIAIAAAEVSVGLAIVIALHRMSENIDLDIFDKMKG